MLDLAGHGRSLPLVGAALRLRRLAADVVAVLDALGVESALAVGQSLGGGVAVLVDEARPGLFGRLVLCEAVAFPTTTTTTGGPNPMSERARNRRAVWADRDEFVGSKPPLSALDALDALDAYARWGLLDRRDGGVQLACEPDASAAVFEVSGTPHGAPAAWAHLPSLHAPAVVAAGDRSCLPAALFEQQAAHAGGLPLHVVSGGHFLVQEDAGRVAKLLRARLCRE